MLCVKPRLCSGWLDTLLKWLPCWLGCIPAWGQAPAQTHVCVQAGLRAFCLVTASLTWLLPSLNMSSCANRQLWGPSESSNRQMTAWPMKHTLQESLTLRFYFCYPALCHIYLCYSVRTLYDTYLIQKCVVRCIRVKFWSSLDLHQIHPAGHHWIYFVGYFEPVW